jgi:L-seryl-tRNA(Ser) seleniumtransferase
LTGAERGLVVNNNAAAIMLGLAATAFGKEVIVSRGESSEIGGGFRIPDVLKQSGAKLVEVGTVNRTYAEDYEQAITPKTAAILVVHRSNFSVIGFTHEPSLKEIVAVGVTHGVPVLHDIGGGALLNTSDFGLAHEPMPQESIALGSDLVFFSGDKLLGGPQAGIIVGKSGPISKLEKHPLMRVLRSDKITLASLHATLLHYIRGDALAEIPIWRMISTSLSTLKRRSEAITKSLGIHTVSCLGNSTIGGGSLPGQELESWLVRINTSTIDGGAAEFARKLRIGTPPIVSRIEEEDVLIDLRTILPDDDHLVVSGLSAALNKA